MVERLVIRMVSAFRKWGIKGTRNSGSCRRLSMSRYISRGAAFARSRLNAAMLFGWLDITAQFSGVEMMDTRQYRHT